MIDFNFNGEPARIVGDSVHAEDETLRDLLKMLAEALREQPFGGEVPDLEEYIVKGLERWGRVEIIRHERPETDFDPQVDY